MKYYTILAITILAIIAISTPVSADHDRCQEHDCPSWAKYSNYVTPSYSSTSSYDDYQYTYRQPRITHYEIINVQHPPRHMYVHYNQNYYYHYGSGRYNTNRNTRYNNYQYQRTQTIHHGNGFTRYY
jgi:hypothetical protein